MIYFQRSLLTGCSSGPRRTLVDNLRVLVLVPESPEIAPNETTGLDIVVADPLERGFDRLTWTCTRLGPECAEALLDPDSPWLRLEAEAGGASGLSTGSVTASPALFEVASQDPLPLVQVFTLVCEPGLCDVLDAALAGVEPDSAAADQLQSDLTDPFSLLEDLPLEGVSLASWTVDVSTRSPEDRRSHPSLGPCTLTDGDGDGEATAESVAPEGTLKATCPVEGPFDADAGLWGYGTAGGWGADRDTFGNDATEVEGYTWFAPKAKDAPEAPVDLWLVLTDGLGGLAGSPSR